MKTDNKTLNLLSRAQTELSKMENVKKPNYKTNCVLHLEGASYNLHTLPVENLQLLMAKLSAYNMGYTKLELEDNMSISGFTLDDWLYDLKLKYNLVSQRKKKDHWLGIINRLNGLLSSDAKIEIELDEIERMFE